MYKIVVIYSVVLDETDILKENKTHPILQQKKAEYNKQ